mgnify:CR=1 FL=1
MRRARRTGGTEMRSRRQRFLVIQGTLVKVRGDMQEFVVRFGHVWMFRGSTFTEKVSVFQNNDWVEGLLKVSDMRLVEDSSTGTPQMFVEVTFTSDQPVKLSTEPQVLFTIDNFENVEPTFKVDIPQM